MFRLFKRPDPAILARKVATDYLGTLEGGSDDERGTILWAAQRARVLYEDDETIAPGVLLMPFAVAPVLLMMTRAVLSEARQQAAKAGSEHTVSGIDVWLLTILAVQDPMMRVQGRHLWGMLARGIEEARFRAQTGHLWVPDASSARLLAEIDGIPDGLEPRDVTGAELRVGTPGALLTERHVQRLDSVKADREAAKPRSGS